LKKYWSRLALGILLGVMFGLFNASFVWGTRVIFERMEPAKPKVENATENSSVSKGKGILQKLDAVVDACLPRRGEPMNWQQALGGLLFLPLLVGLRGSMNFSSGYCMVWASSYAIRDLKLDTHSKLQSLSMDYFQKKEIGQHTMLLNRGIESLQRCLDHGFSDAVKEPFAVLAIAISLFILDWQLALFGLVFVPLTLFPIIFLGRRVRKIAKAAYAQGTDQDSLLVQVYTNMRTIKAFCLEKVQLERFGKMYQRLARLGIKQNQARLILNPTVEVLGIVGLGAVIVFVFYHGKSAPDLVAFLTGSMLMYQPIKKLGNLNATVQEAMAGVERIEEVQRAEATVAEGDDSKPLRPLAEMIRIENVTFSYGDETVLRNLTVDLPKGTKLGVAGESGAGKSTLVSLMLRFYDPGEGRITIDGTDIREASFASLRGQIALVSQEVVIFDQSVSDNIACGKLDATPEEIAAAARAANADAFIENLPEGYGTRLGEEGTRLSGGQRQRIALARAFVRQAPILILDEATASLDSKAEAEVQGAIDHLEEGRTVICVAHRLSTLRGMDQIIVLDAGRIVEQGSFSELLARDGPFAAMARKQGISSEAVRS
jgi:subfamily B ATP-binding cassette protein MsbA